MNIWYSKYEKGCLLKVEFADSLTGYADLHPWPELGDETYEEHLESLRTLKYTQRVERSIELARRDAEARNRRLSLLIGAEDIKNHHLITDPLKVQLNQEISNDFIKIKMGHDLLAETNFLQEFCQKLKPEQKLRLDFNGRISPEEMSTWLSDVKDWLFKHIDYLEDPAEYSASLWSEWRSKYNLRLALDWLADPETEDLSADVIVIKPVSQSPDLILLKQKDKEITFTHSMDHLVGQMSAWGELLRLKPQLGNRLITCGLETYCSKENNSYIETIQDFPHNERVEFGIGFDRQLNKENWEKLLCQ